MMYYMWVIKTCLSSLLKSAITVLVWDLNCIKITTTYFTGTFVNNYQVARENQTSIGIKNWMSLCQSKISRGLADTVEPKTNAHRDTYT